MNTIPIVNFYGIDGCKGGWVVASGAIENGSVEHVSYVVVRELQSMFNEALKGGSVVAIDIPIGLSDRHPRQCDLDARAFLGPPRASSVFPAPYRCCLMATTYEEACRGSFEATGKKLSKQSYAILPKIAEVDALISAEMQRYVREAHPEVSFAVLVGKPMAHRKTTLDGIAERLSVLEANGLVLTLDDVQNYRHEIGRGQVHVDDIIDASVCLLTANRIAAGKSRVFGGNERDSSGLRMEIVA